MLSAPLCSGLPLNGFPLAASRTEWRGEHAPERQTGRLLQSSRMMAGWTQQGGMDAGGHRTHSLGEELFEVDQN